MGLSAEFFGSGDQLFINQNFILSLELFHGEFDCCHLGVDIHLLVGDRVEIVRTKDLIEGMGNVEVAEMAFT